VRDLLREVQRKCGGPDAENRRGDNELEEKFPDTKTRGRPTFIGAVRGRKRGLRNRNEDGNLKRRSSLSRKMDASAQRNVQTSMLLGPLEAVGTRRRKDTGDQTFRFEIRCWDF